MDTNCGIYVITSPSGSIYVGSSVNIKARWSHHRGELRRGTHHSRALLRAAKKYGIENLKFEFIARCGRENLRDLEQLVIDVAKPEYNLSKSTYEPFSDLWKDPAFIAMRSECARQVCLKLWKDPKFASAMSARAKLNFTPEIVAKAQATKKLKRQEDPDYCADSRAAASERFRKMHAAPEYKERLKERQRTAMLEQRQDAKFLALVADVHRKRLSRQVRCVETGEVFPSARAAVEKMRQLTGRRCSIELAARTGTKAGRFHWEYLDGGVVSAIQERMKDPEFLKRHAVVTKARCKPVRCVETGIVFPSAKAAAAWAAIKPSSAINVAGAARGHCKTAGGYHWQWVNGDQE